MTPLVAPGVSYFSEISARILESTFLGDKWDKFDIQNAIFEEKKCFKFKLDYIIIEGHAFRL